MAKLSEADVSEVRRRCAAGETQASVARAYGVARTTISAIVVGRNWTR
jgi:DNA-binding XRE family transcriptional regulator